MNKRLILILLISLPLLLVACGDDEAENDSVNVVSMAKHKADKPKDVDVAPPELVIPPADDRRNPFKSFLAKVPPPKKDDRVKGPLECCSLSALRVKAVMTGRVPRATIMVPGNKSYIVTVGMYIGNSDGKISEITSGGLIVKVPVFDEKGDVLYTEDIEVNLPGKE